MPMGPLIRIPVQRKGFLSEKELKKRNTWFNIINAGTEGTAQRHETETEERKRHSVGQKRRHQPPEAGCSGGRGAARRRTESLEMAQEAGRRGRGDSEKKGSRGKSERENRKREGREGREDRERAGSQEQRRKERRKEKGSEVENTTPRRDQRGRARRWWNQETVLDSTGWPGEW